MQEMQVQCPSGEDHLEKEMATTHSSIAWEIPWTEDTGGLHVLHGYMYSMYSESQESDTAY